MASKIELGNKNQGSPRQADAAAKIGAKGNQVQPGASENAEDNKDKVEGQAIDPAQAAKDALNNNMNGEGGGAKSMSKYQQTLPLTL